MWQLKSYLKDARELSMAQDHNDIYTIVERLRILEEGLNTNQKSVNQLSATFKPKTVAVLTAKTDPKNPMAGKLVGGCEESEEPDETVLEADMSEDVLDKVKKSFTDFIKSVEDKIEDSDIKEKKTGDSDLKSKDKPDRTLVAKESELGSALSGVVPAAQPAGEPGVSMKESAPVKTLTNECGIWEMHGNERDGFEVRRAGRCLPTRFKNLDEAEMAVEMFAHRRRKADESQDYMEER
jgi:hypothetical protein